MEIASKYESDFEILYLWGFDETGGRNGIITKLIDTFVFLYALFISGLTIFIGQVLYLF